MSAPSTSPKSHPCDACGGCGKRNYVQPGCSQYDNPCQVCLGSGRVSDVMPSRDAVADAETLRKAVLSCVVSPYHNRARRDVADASHRVSHDCDTWYHWLDAARWPEIAKDLAVSAARAAFRACPGLRG